MHLFRKVAMGLGISLLALEEIIKQLYDPIYSGAIFLGTGVKIKHKFLNYLNNQNTKFLVVGDGYNKWDCSGFGKIGAESLFLYSNVKSSDDYSLCGNLSIKDSLEGILENTRYVMPYLGFEIKPHTIEIFGSRTEILLDKISALSPDTIIVSHSGREQDSLSSISDFVILEKMSTFVDDVYYRFILNIFLNPDKTIIAKSGRKFIVDPMSKSLCNGSSIMSFQDQMSEGFKEFYSSIGGESVSSKISRSKDFFKQDQFPFWYKELQEKYLEDFKTLLLVQNILLGNLREAECLIADGVSINRTLYNGVSPIIVSVTTGNENMVKFCLEKGADMNQARDNGVTPIMIASHFKYNGILQILLEKGGNLELHKQFNILSAAYEAKNYDAIPIILKTAFGSEYAELARQFVKERIHMECFNGKTEFSGFYKNIVENISPDPSASYMTGVFMLEFDLSFSEQSCLLGGVEQEQT